MASTHILYKRFNDSIKLSEARKGELRTSRDAIRGDIAQWLADNDKGQTRFKLQGSFAMNTVVNPIDDDEFDIDDGLYLKRYEDSDRSSWPSCSTVHGWVLSAVRGRTSTPPKDKNACVRITYGHGYHVDVPIYIKLNEVGYYADKSKGWTASDAEGFVDWLDDKGDLDGQLKRIIRYLKRWKDCCDAPLKGIELTILCANNYCPAINRDDDAVRYTAEAVLASLKASFECRKPVASWEDLFENASDSKKKTILTKLETLIEELVAAADETDELAASEHLRTVFGDDFPKGDPSKNAPAYVVTSAPAVLKHDGRSG